MDLKEKRAIKKQQKQYRRWLELKAEVGGLSLNEKEQYQAMCRSRARNRMLSGEKWRSRLVGIGFLV